jgi:hypothetical protein
MSYVELEQFALAEGVTRDSFGVLDDGLQAWSYTHRERLLRRTTAYGNDGRVLVVTLFASGEVPAALGLDTVAPTDRGVDPVNALREAIAQGSYRRAVFEDRG